MYIVWLLIEACVLCWAIVGWFYNFYIVFSGKSEDRQEFFARLIGVPLFPLGMLLGMFSTIQHIK